MGTSHASEHSTIESALHNFLPPSPSPPPVAHTNGRGGGGHLSRLEDRAEANREKWAGYHRTPAEHLLILIEEVGEVARAMQEGNGGYDWPPAYNAAVYQELADVGAVVLAMMGECGE